MPTQLIETQTGENWLQPFIHPEDARTMNVVMKAAAATYLKGQVLAQNSTTKKYEAYANGGATGTGRARVVCAYDFSTDAQGMVILPNRGELSQPYASVYCKVNLKTTDLVGTGVQANLASVLADLNASQPTDAWVCI